MFFGKLKGKGVLERILMNLVIHRKRSEKNTDLKQLTSLSPEAKPTFKPKVGVLCIQFEELIMNKQFPTVSISITNTIITTHYSNLQPQKKS